MNDGRSRRFVFIPFCLMCPAFQADGIVKEEWVSYSKQIVQFLLDCGLNIIQLPCPESSYNGYEAGLSRQAMGLKGYSIDEYKLHCDILADNVLKMVQGIIKNGYGIIAILGIENSPSCAVNNIYTNKGTVKRKGVFFEALYSCFEESDIVIDFVGIRKRNITASLKQLNALTNEEKST